MPISSSSFFHFTSGRYTALKGILQKGFRVSVSPEILTLSHPETNFFDLFMVGVPMVCFCDIPLSICGLHAEFYCDEINKKQIFGIGMNRDWGISILSPVIYYNKRVSGKLLEEYELKNNLLRKTSMLLSINDQSDKYGNLIKEINDHLTDTNRYLHTKISENSARFEDYPNIFMRIKPYTQDYYLNEDLEIRRTDYIFYDEREWRYVPNSDFKQLPHFSRTLALEAGGFTIFDELIESVMRSKEEYHKIVDVLKIIYEDEKNYLKFAHNDISWIIVDNESTAKKLIYEILNNFEFIGGYEISSADQRYSLISKIITYDQIKKDIFTH